MNEKKHKRMIELIGIINGRRMEIDNEIRELKSLMKMFEIEMLQMKPLKNTKELI